MSKHINNGNCPSCKDIIKDASDTLKTWFAEQQALDNELHASCGYRNRADQDAAKASGVSKANFGESPHNYVPSRAIDIFFIRNGKAVYDIAGYQAIAAKQDPGIEWGGNFPGFKDMPHFQEIGWKKLIKNYPNGN